MPIQVSLIVALKGRELTTLVGGSIQCPRGEDKFASNLPMCTVPVRAAPCLLQMVG